MRGVPQPARLRRELDATSVRVRGVPQAAWTTNGANAKPPAWPDSRWFAAFRGFVVQMARAFRERGQNIGRKSVSSVDNMRATLTHALASPHVVLGGLFALSLLAFLALIPAPRVDGQLIGSDGVSYYVFLRSAVIDGDLDFRNEFAYYSQARPELRPLADGRLGNKYGVGAALLWLPFFALAHSVALTAAALSLPVRPDGLGYLYQSAIAIGSICYGAAGFLLIYGSARRLCGANAALFAVAGLWLASNALYYIVIEPSMAHMVGLFSVALLYAYWHEQLWRRAPSLRAGALLGLAGGLVLLVRLQDAPLLLAPYGYLLWGWLRGATPLTPAPRRAWLAAGVAAGAGTFVALLPQLVAWRLIYGAWVALPYLQDADPAFFWLQPHLAGVLISAARGLFVWHPIYALAAAGLALLARRDRALAALCALALAADIYLVAAWWAWTQGDSFGGRMFISAMWIWGVGLAALLEPVLARPRIAPAALAAGMALALWNGLALVQYRLVFVGRPALPGWGEITIERLLLPVRLLEQLLR